jgi:hypothetical protein
MRPIVFLAVLLFASHAVAQSPLFTFGPSAYQLGTNTENRETPEFRVGPFGWFQTTMHEQHGVWYYPTPADAKDAGYFSFDPHNAITADFNGDGRQDLLITWAIFPHTIERDSKTSFSILLNNGDGSMRYAPEMFGEAGPPKRHLPYRTAMADFNSDGKPDVVAAPMGMFKRNPDGSTTTVYEPILMILSTPSGVYVDGSHLIEGQEAGGTAPGFTFGHELSSGDVNGDGHADIFTGKFLFLGDGTGRFTNATSTLPAQIRPTSTYLMTSLIGDFDGDGKGDIVAAYAENPDVSGYVHMSKTNTVVALPPGLFGNINTKYNSGMVMDVDGDGRLDIVFGVTRATPYYEGRRIQVIRNVSDGVFEDATAALVVEFPYLDQLQGEGHFQLADVDRDGIPDLVHSGSGPYNETGNHGLTIFLTKGGQLRQVDPSTLPWVQPWQIAGEEFLREWQRRPGMQRAYMVDLDGEAGLDIVSGVIPPLRSWPQNQPSEFVFYSILSKGVLTSIDQEDERISEMALHEAYPNPFNPSTEIRWTLDVGRQTRLVVHDLMGREVAVLVDGVMPAGEHRVSFDASALASGVYLYTLTSGGRSLTQKMTVVK